QPRIEHARVRVDARQLLGETLELLADLGLRFRQLGHGPGRQVEAEAEVLGLDPVDLQVGERLLDVVGGDLLGDVLAERERTDRHVAGLLERFLLVLRVWVDAPLLLRIALRERGRTECRERERTGDAGRAAAVPREALHLFAHSLAILMLSNTDR